MPVIRFSNAAVNQLTNSMGTYLNSGTIKIYSGTIPTNADTAIGAQTLLLTFAITASAFDAAALGVSDLAGLPISATAVAGGVASFARIEVNGGGAAIDCDVTATAGGGVVQISDTTIVDTDPYDLTAFNYTSPKS